MTTAARISIQLDAQTAELKRGFAETKAAVTGLGQNMSGAVAGGIAKFHIALAGVKAVLGAIRGTINGVLESMGRLASTADFADRIGIGVEALQALQFAAEQNGSSAETMNMSLQRLTRRVAQAASGSGELVGVLEELGLNAQAMAQLAPDEQFRVFADAIANTSERGDQMRMTMAAMDTEGVALVELLSQGSAKIEEWGEKAAETGIASEAMARQAQTAQAALLRWNRAWTQFKDVLVAYVLPAITKVIEAVTWLVSKLAQLFGRDSVQQPLKPLADSARAAVHAMPPVTEQIEEITAATKASKEATIDFKRELEDIKTPSIGAVTKASAAGFSAVQQANRSARDELDRQHRERQQVLLAILAALRGGMPILQPVDL